MIDELDQYFDDHDRGRSRHRHGGRFPQQQPPPSRGSGGRKKKKKKGHSGLAFFLVLLLLAGLGGGVYFGYNRIQGYFGTEDYSGAGTGEVQVQVAKDESLTEIGNELYRKGVVKSSKAFIEASNANPKSKSIEVGYYKLKKQMKASLALTALLARNADGTLANKVSTRVTIPEGTIAQDIYPLLAKATNLPVQNFIDAAKDPMALGVPDYWYKREDGKPQQNPPSIEGFLFPATYDFDPGSDAKKILSDMVNQFLTVAGELKFTETVQSYLSISPYEALIVASITQVEAKMPKDMPGVARVLYNRAYSGKFPCNCLQIDSSVNYWLRITGKEAKESGNLSSTVLHDRSDPYSYEVTGMLPTPISNPGKDALNAAMTAPKNNNLYFLAIDTAGNTAFATTYAQFCALTHTAKANGVNLGTCNG
jgi:UPF0755 protein